MLINLSGIEFMAWSPLQTVLTVKYGGVIDLYYSNTYKDVNNLEINQIANSYSIKIKDICQNFKILNAVLFSEDDRLIYNLKEKLSTVNNLSFLKCKYKDGKFIKYMEV